MGSAVILSLKRLPGWWPLSFFTRSEEYILQAGIGLALLSTWTLLIGLCGSLSVISLSAPAFVAAAIVLFFQFSKQPLRLRKDQTIVILNGFQSQLFPGLAFKNSSCTDCSCRFPSTSSWAV